MFMKLFTPNVLIFLVNAGRSLCITKGFKFFDIFKK